MCRPGKERAGDQDSKANDPHGTRPMRFPPTKPPAPRHQSTMAGYIRTVAAAVPAAVPTGQEILARQRTVLIEDLDIVHYAIVHVIRPRSPD
jgi:hypothetical protein